MQLTSETDKQWLAYLHAELGPDLGVLPRILAHWKTTGKAIVTRSTAQSAVDGYLDYRKAQVSARTLADNRCRLSRFKVQLGDRQLSDLIPADFRGFLDSFTDRTSRRNYYKSLAPWVKLCVEKRLLVINPLSEIKRPKANEGEPEVYSVDAFQSSLETCWSRDHSLCRNRRIGWTKDGGNASRAEIRSGFAMGGRRFPKPSHHRTPRSFKDR